MVSSLGLSGWQGMLGIVVSQVLESLRLAIREIDRRPY